MYISNNFIKIFRKNDLNKQYRHSFVTTKHIRGSTYRCSRNVVLLKYNISFCFPLEKKSRTACP